STPATTRDGATPFAESGKSEAGASATSDAGPDTALGLNHVTLLAALAESSAGALMRASDLMDDGTPLVPRALFDRLNDEPAPLFGAPVVPREAYEALQLVAVRFELCDRNQP